MNDTLQIELADLVNKAKNAGASVFEYLQQQAPDVVEQMLRWKLVNSILYAASGVVVSVAFLIISILLVSYLKKHGDDPDSDFAVAPLAVSAVFFVIGCIVSLVSICTAIEIYIAPKWYLVETMLNKLK